MTETIQSAEMLMWNGGTFSDTKIALVCGDRVIVYLHDEKADIPFPGLWDLPGGRREGEEDPVACALREVHEELGLKIQAERVEKLTRYPSPTPPGLDTYFSLATVEAAEIEQVMFGSEGQRWSLMGIDVFIHHEKGVPHLQARLAEYFPEA